MEVRKKRAKKALFSKLKLKSYIKKKKKKKASSDFHKHDEDGYDDGIYESDLDPDNSQMHMVSPSRGKRAVDDHDFILRKKKDHKNNRFEGRYETKDMEDADADIDDDSMDRETYPNIPHFISGGEYKSNLSNSFSYDLDRTGSFGSILSAPTVMQSQRPQSMVSSPLSTTSTESIQPTPSFDKFTTPSGKSTSTYNSNISQNSFFTSTKLRRLEELKKYQQNQHNLFHPQPYEQSALFHTPTRSLSSSPQSSPQANHRTPPSSPRSSPLRLEQQQPPSSSSSISSSQLSFPLSSSSSPTTQSRRNVTQESSNLLLPPLSQVPRTPQPSTCSTSCETTGYIFAEEKLMTFIHDSPLRITSSILFLMMTLFWLLSVDPIGTSTTEITTNKIDMDDVVNVSMNVDWWYHHILRIIGEIFTTNMKLYLFIKVYSLILDIMLISAFDNVDIPIIHNAYKQQRHEGEEIRDNDDEQEEEEQKRQEAKVYFHNLSTTFKEENKNPVIRQYAIEKIRQGTSHAAIGIVGCGLVKGVVYSSLNCLVYMANYSLVLYRMFRLTLMTEDKPLSFTPTVIVWLEHTIQIPISFVSIFSQYVILPICKYSGITWVVEKFASSVLNASSLSLCTQCMNVTQNLMMHAGIFMLVFYLILVHSFPQKSAGDGSRRKIDFTSNGTSTSRDVVVNR